MCCEREEVQRGCGLRSKVLWKTISGGPETTCTYCTFECFVCNPHRCMLPHCILQQQSYCGNRHVLYKLIQRNMQGGAETLLGEGRPFHITILVG